MKTPAQQLAHLHQQQQQRQQQLQQLHGQHLRQHQQQQHAVQQQHPLNIKQEVVDNNATGQTQQNINQNSSNNIGQNIGGSTNTGSNGVVGIPQPHVNKASGNGHFVDSTTTNPMTTLAGFSTHNNNTLSRSGSCDNITGPGTSSNSNRDLFSLQEELLNGTFCQLFIFLLFFSVLTTTY